VQVLMNIVVISCVILRYFRGVKGKENGNDKLHGISLKGHFAIQIIYYDRVGAIAIFYNSEGVKTLPI